MITKRQILKLKLPTRESVKKLKTKERLVYLRFFNPISEGEWFVWAADIINDDVLFYGQVKLSHITEETFSLNELKKLKLPFNLRIEWDESFIPQKDVF